MSKVRVAIVGAGGSGLTAIKCCLDEGLTPVCFEQERYVGGMWNFTEENSVSSSVYRSTVINTSKEMMCFSDFPVPKEFPPFMHNTYVMKYFQLYAENFGLQKYIFFGHQVLNISKSNDFEISGKWLVTTKFCEDNESNIQHFDAVLICTGHHWQPSWPTFKGMDTFLGPQIHSHSYKDFMGYEGKTVLVVGMFHSSCKVQQCCCFTVILHILYFLTMIDWNCAQYAKLSDISFCCQREQTDVENMELRLHINSYRAKM